MRLHWASARICGFFSLSRGSFRLLHKISSAPFSAFRHILSSDTVSASDRCHRCKSASPSDASAYVFCTAALPSVSHALLQTLPSNGTSIRLPFRLFPSSPPLGNLLIFPRVRCFSSPRVRLLIIMIVNTGASKQPGAYLESPL